MVAVEGTEWPDSIPQGRLRDRMCGVGKTGVSVPCSIPGAGAELIPISSHVKEQTKRGKTPVSGSPSGQPSLPTLISPPGCLTSLEITFQPLRSSQPLTTEVLAFDIFSFATLYAGY